MKIYPKIALSFSDQSLFSIDFHRLGFTASIYKADLCIALFGADYGRMIDRMNVKHSIFGRNK